MGLSKFRKNHRKTAGYRRVSRNKNWSRKSRSTTDVQEQKKFEDREMASKEESTVDVVMGEPSSEINSFSTKDQLKAECLADYIEEESKLTIEELEFVKTEIKSNEEESKCFPIKLEVGEPSSAGNSQIPIKAEVKQECSDEDIEESANEEGVLEFCPVAKKPEVETYLMSDVGLRRIAGAINRLNNSENSNETEVKHKFCVKYSLSPADIHIAVEGIGNLEFPLTSDCIEELKTISSKAKFGVGEKTVLDENFRDTHVIESTKLEVKIEEQSLLRILRNMREALNLSNETTLNAHLYNLLIYGPGQFFDLHRDSEKIPNMIATLVIVLPSPHIGGDLIVQQGDRKTILSTENLNETNAKCICFFSDCWHKVKKVKCGYRVVLTYNVALQTGDAPSLKLANRYLECAVKDYFKYNDKLIFLLNHSYSQHSLRWSLLKGEDYVASSNFLAVAKSLNLILHLALVDIHHIFSCTEDEDGYDQPTSPIIGELCDYEYRLDYWIDEHNNEVSYKKYDLDLSDVCFTSETSNTFKPTESDHSGPTGNEGCTVDNWYKRAAIVMWKQSDLEKTQFELCYEGSFKNLLSLIKTDGNEPEVCRLLDAAGKKIYHYKTTFCFGSFVDIAIYVKDETKAEKLLSHFDGSSLTVNNMLHLIALQNEYGIEFCIKLFQDWLGKCQIQSLFPFTAEFLKAGGEQSLASAVVEYKVNSIINEKSSYYYNKRPPLSQQQHFENVKAIEAIGKTELLKTYITHAIKDIRTSTFVDTFIQIQTAEPNNEKFEPFRQTLIDAVKTEVNKSCWVWEKSSLWCSCELCKRVNNFLKSEQESIRINGNNRKHFADKIYSQPLDMAVQGRGKTALTVLTKQVRVRVEYQNDIKKLKVLLEKLEKVGVAVKRKAFGRLKDSPVVKSAKK